MIINCDYVRCLGASQDKRKEIKQKENNQQAVYVHHQKGYDAKNDFIIHQTPSPPVEIVHESPIIDYHDISSNDDNRIRHIFLRTTLAPHHLRTTQAIHYITIAKNLTLDSGRQKLATLRDVFGNNPITIRTINDNQPKVPNSVSLPIISLDGDRQVRQKIIITKPQADSDSKSMNNNNHDNNHYFSGGIAFQQSIVGKDLPSINLNHNNNNQPTHIVEKTRDGGIKITEVTNTNSNQKIINGITFGQPTVIDIDNSNNNRPSQNEKTKLVRNFPSYIFDNVNSPENKDNNNNSNEQKEKGKPSPIAFEEPPRAINNNPSNQADKQSEQFGKINRPSLPGNLREYRTYYVPHNHPIHHPNRPNYINEFEFDINHQPPLNYGGGYVADHQLELPPTEYIKVLNPWENPYTTVDPVVELGQIVGNAIFSDGPPMPPPAGHPHAPPPPSVIHYSRGPVHRPDINVPLWVRNLRGESNYFLNSNLAPSHASKQLKDQNGKPLTKPIFTKLKLPAAEKLSKLFKAKLKNQPNQYEAANHHHPINSVPGSVTMNESKQPLTHFDSTKFSNIGAALSVGFDSHRLNSTKSRELITQSSEIYPLIGGISPFLIPSTLSNSNKTKNLS